MHVEKVNLSSVYNLMKIFLETAMYTLYLSKIICQYLFCVLSSAAVLPSYKKTEEQLSTRTSVKSA